MKDRRCSAIWGDAPHRASDAERSRDDTGPQGFIDQVPDTDDQRQRLLRITRAGSKLWEELPDPIALIQAVSFDGADDAELATALRVLQAATGRLNDHLSAGSASARLADRREASV